MLRIWGDVYEILTFEYENNGLTVQLNTQKTVEARNFPHTFVESPYVALQLFAPDFKHFITWKSGLDKSNLAIKNAQSDEEVYVFDEDYFNIVGYAD